jgi:outer membrane protein
MKRYLSIACLLMLVASSVAGAATKGSNELLFGFNGLSNLNASTFDGGIGVRHYVSDNMAYRPSVTLGFGSSKTDGVGGFTDHKFTNNNIGVTLAMEKHTGDSKTLSPYMGLGVGFSTFSDKQEYTHAAAPATGTALSQTISGMSYNVFGLAGFQWFFTENISLGGEYQLGLNGSSDKTENETQGAATTTFKGSGFNLGLGTAQLSLSVAL